MSLIYKHIGVKFLCDCYVTNQVVNMNGGIKTI